MIYVVRVNGDNRAAFTNKKAANEYAKALEYKADNVQVDKLNLNIKAEIPQSVNVSGVIYESLYGTRKTDIISFSVDGAGSDEWTFTAPRTFLGGIDFTGSVLVDVDKTPKQFRKHIKQVCSKKYKEWKLPGYDNNECN